MPHLAPQALLDCVPPTVNGSLQAVITAKGCHGGWPATAAKWIEGIGGLPTDNAYTYRGTDGYCGQFTPFGGTPWPWKLSANYLPNDVATIEAAVRTNGAVVATIQVLNDFLLYTDGVYDQALCTGAALSHAVVIVGFGTDASTSAEYWLIKNSFGRAWGEAGYVRMAKGKNMCGIESNWPLALSLIG